MIDKKPIIFVGSSTEQLELAQKIELWLDQEDCEVRMWTEVFEAGDYTADRLLRESKKCDGAIFVFGEDDKTWFRSENLKSPRDNVVYELGLFTGSSSNESLKRIIFCRIGKSKVASDLEGISYIYIDPYNPTRPKTKEEIKSYAKRIKRLNSSPAPEIFKMTPKKELFNIGTEMISRSTVGITLAAKTPVPLVGPRPYENRSSAFQYEVDQYNKYWNIAEKSAQNKIKFTLIASLPAIREIYSSVSDPKFKSDVKDNLCKFYEFSEKSDGYLKIFWNDGLSPPAFLVADSESLLWWKAGNGDSIWCAHASKSLAEALSSSVSAPNKQMQLREVMQGLE